MSTEIVEGNKLIAEFMGGELREKSYWIRDKYVDAIFFDVFESDGRDTNVYIPICLRYHESWSWIMPVVEKIESLKSDDYEYNVVIGFKNYCGIAQSKKRVLTKWESSHLVTEPNKMYTWKPDTKKEAIFIACVKFIKWYNEHNQ